MQEIVSYLEENKNRFKKILGLDTVLLGFGLPNENAHAPDEFIDLENFFNGMKTVAHFYHELARQLNQY